MVRPETIPGFRRLRAFDAAARTGSLSAAARTLGVTQSALSRAIARLEALGFDRSACIEAYRITAEQRWRHQARRVFHWFLGRNDVGVPLYDSATGGCCDGLQRGGVNRNQGAESTLACLWTKWLGITARQLEWSDATHVSRSATVPLAALPTKAPADDPHRETAALS